MEFCCSSSSSTLIAATRLPPANPSKLSSSNAVFFRNDLRDRTQKLVSCRVGVPPSSRRRFGGFRCLFGLGVPELVVIAGVAALVFGPKKLPEIGRSIGKTVKSFQEAAKEFETELKKEPEGSGSITSSDEKSIAVDKENEEKKLETSGTKENA